MYRQTLRRHVDRTLALELEDNPNLDTEERLKELEIQYGLVTPENTETGDSKCDWKLGYPKEKWAKCMAVIDIVKGTFGLIFAAYISFVLFGLMANQDFEDLKRRLSRTEFAYLLAYVPDNYSGMGISLTVCGCALWNFLLIGFGKVLFDAANQRRLGKLRLWYAYAFLSNIVFLLLYIRLILAHIECQDRNLCQKSHNTIVWLVAEIYYLFSFLPSIYTIAIVHSLISEIRSQQLKELRYIRQSRSQNNTLTRPTSRGSYYRHGDRQNAHSPVLSPVSSVAMINPSITPTATLLNNYTPSAIPVSIPFPLERGLPPIKMPTVPKGLHGFNL